MSDEIKTNHPRIRPRAERVSAPAGPSPEPSNSGLSPPRSEPANRTPAEPRWARFAAAAERPVTLRKRRPRAAAVTDPAPPRPHAAAVDDPPAPAPPRTRRGARATVAEPPPPVPPIQERLGPPDEPPADGGGSGGGEPAPRPRLLKLRFLLILIGLAVLAVISTVFGMMMAVASDLPQLENTQQYVGRDSFLYDYHWRRIGLFAPPNHYVIDSWKEISPAMVRAIISVEDRRFWTDPGVDIRGIARAFFADITGGATQGASTIAQQFVKNTLHEEANRTVFEKLREAALAFQLTHKWRRTKILTEYLNSIYFGNGAYGVESAARVYFGKAANVDYNPSPSPGQPGCGDATPGIAIPKCASKLRYWQAALLAGMVANPSAFDPTEHPSAARARRELVLKDMLDQHYITSAQFAYGNAQTLPASADLQQPQEPAAAPYFTSWLRPQILAAMGYHRGVADSLAQYRAFYGGLRIRTTLDLQLQQAADQAVENELPYGSDQPAVSLVAIDNQTGQVRAMVGGPIVNGQEDYNQYPFNLATEAERQPGSAFKPFTLARALEAGYGPSSLFVSAPFDVGVPHGHGEVFHVRNFGNQYSGTISLQGATDYSDNSVYARLGILDLARYGGTPWIAELANNMGIRTPVSQNYAMILGGLKVGVSPLDLAHAYETFATGGRRVYNSSLGAPHRGPIGIAEIQCPIAHVCPHKDMVAKPMYQRVLPANIAAIVHQMLEGPVAQGTATQAAIPGVVVAGKTGTTTNYADAWFVGWTPQITTAVWVGYPDRLVPMTTLYNGQPVEGGTFPAIIWHNFVTQALQILASEQAASSTSTSNTTATGSASGVSTGAGSQGPTTSAQTTASTTASHSSSNASQGTAPSTSGSGSSRGGTTPGSGSGTAGNSGSGSGSGGQGSGSGGAGIGGGGGTVGGGTAGGTAGGATNSNGG